MHTRLALLGAIAGLALLAASAARAADMPTVEDLQAQMGAPAATVTVYEPHLSVGDAHTSVDFYEAAEVKVRCTLCLEHVCLL